MGQKLFLKGEKCFLPKCPLIKKPYGPGQKRKKRKSGVSEYKKELLSKQQIKLFYGLSEKQFAKYVKEVLKKRGKVEDASLLLLKKLEKRLDNVIYRLGLATSRAKARQLVSHSYFLVDDKPVNIPSYQVKKGEKILLKERKKEKPYFKRISSSLKQVELPSWLLLDREKIIGEVVGEPSLDEAGLPTETTSIFEYYSR